MISDCNPAGAAVHVSLRNVLKRNLCVFGCIVCYISLCFVGDVCVLTRDG